MRKKYIVFRGEKGKYEYFIKDCGWSTTDDLTKARGYYKMETAKEVLKQAIRDSRKNDWTIIFV